MFHCHNVLINLATQSIIVTSPFDFKIVGKGYLQTLWTSKISHGLCNSVFDPIYKFHNSSGGSSLERISSKFQVDEIPSSLDEVVSLELDDLKSKWILKPTKIETCNCVLRSFNCWVWTFIFRMLSFDPCCIVSLHEIERIMI